MYTWIIRNSFFRLQERIKGHPTFAILRDMEAADRLSASELRALQAAKLHHLLGYAYEHVPYVRQQMDRAGLLPADIHDARDLVRLPVLRKADVRAHRSALRSDISPDLTQFSTGGSTGEPLLFDIGHRRIAARVACRQRVSGWWGMSVGDPEIALWGSPVELTRQDRIRNVRDRLLRTRLLPAFEMNESTMTRYLNILEKSGCAQLFGYPSAIAMLCLHARRQGRDLRRVGVKVAFVTGEVMFPYQRELIAETLGCGVADGYGGRDSGFIAHECPQGGMHVLADAVVVELLDEDGRPAPPGVSGEIVVTDLYSHEAPFIRYGTGDMAIATGRACPCGRPLPLLERIEGRSNDSIVSADGRTINSLAVIYAVREIEGVRQFQIRQKSVDSFDVLIVRGDGYNPGAEQRLRNAWTRLLRSNLEVTFGYVDRIPAERSGKFRHVICDIPASASKVS